MFENLGYGKIKPAISYLAKDKGSSQRNRTLRVCQSSRLEKLEICLLSFRDLNALRT